MTVTPISAAPKPISAGARIGHVHLRTSGIDRVRDLEDLLATA